MFARLVDRTWPLLPSLAGAVPPLVLFSLVNRDNTPRIVVTTMLAAVLSLLAVIAAGIVGTHVGYSLNYHYRCVGSMWPLSGRYRRSHALYQFNGLAIVATAAAVPFARFYPGVAVAVLLLAVACGTVGNRVRARIRASTPPPQRRY